MAELASLFTRAFTGYMGRDVYMDATSLAHFCAADGVDLDYSQLILREGQPVGFGLIARRGWTCHVAAFGIVPEAQEQGVGRQLMDALIAQARERGDHTLTLEVIEQNVRGVRLYRSCGMTPLRQLVGFRGYNLPAEHAHLTQVDPYAVARCISAWAADDLPWPCSGETAMAQGEPAAAYALADTAYALITDPRLGAVVIRGLAVTPKEQRRGWAGRLLRALAAEHPGRQWVVPSIMPEEFAPIFERAGFTPDQTSQFQMQLVL